MAAQDNAATARALNDAFNARDWRAAVALTTPSVELVNMARDSVITGPKGSNSSWAVGPAPFRTAR